ncbi:MAG: adenylosuccinate lyase [Candidatus Thermoplasmatota archaeon]|nr:adenylosuccinate lyase [Candidatus Thermoplasmatota archaeon]
MLVCPLDYRYGRKEMKRLWSAEAKLQAMLDVEAALARAHAQLGNIPKEVADEITSIANTSRVTVERVDEIEGEIKHDIMALAKAMSEQCGDAGKYVHLGATSNDIIDTSNAIIIRDSIEIITSDLKELAVALADRAEEHRDTVMMGRTHGQPATPVTFGLKMAVFAAEVLRHIQRAEEIKTRCCAGKIMGAVGTGAGLGPKAVEIQDIVMKELGLYAEEAPTQLVGRDRYAEALNFMALVVSSLEKFCTEVRNLQRPEILEAAEAFDLKKQVGSSTMVHKKNPITSENVCGLARVVRSLALPEMENMVTWHERDLCNSSAERVLFPHVFILGDDLIIKTAGVFRNLAVYPENMLRNLEATNGLIMGERVMLVLVEKGMGRQEAHELVRQIAMKAANDGLHLREALLKDPIASQKLTSMEIAEALDPKTYTGQAGNIVDDIVSRVRNIG